MTEDKDLQTIEIDLTAGEDGEISESFLRAFGLHVQSLM